MFKNIDGGEREKGVRAGGVGGGGEGGWRNVGARTDGETRKRKLTAVAHMNNIIMHLYSIFNEIGFFHSFIYIYFFIWYWNARPRRSKVPAYPNLMGYFLQEQYQRD